MWFRFFILQYHIVILEFNSVLELYIVLFNWFKNSIFGENTYIFSKYNLIRFDFANSVEKSCDFKVILYNYYMDKRNSCVWREETLLAIKNIYEEVIAPALASSLGQVMNISFGLKPHSSPFLLMQLRTKGDGGDVRRSWDLMKELTKLLGCHFW